RVAATRESDVSAEVFGASLAGQVIAEVTAAFVIVVVVSKSVSGSVERASRSGHQRLFRDRRVLVPGEARRCSRGTVKVRFRLIEAAPRARAYNLEAKRLLSAQLE